MEFALPENINWQAWAVLTFLFVICPVWIFKFLDMPMSYRIMVTAGGTALCYVFAQKKGSK